jgi:hypothetical protein
METREFGVQSGLRPHCTPFFGIIPYELRISYIDAHKNYWAQLSVCINCILNMVNDVDKTDRIGYNSEIAVHTIDERIQWSIAIRLFHGATSSSWLGQP